ncbi:hypothetical protein [Kordia sp.]|uniref:hypothetical protein n=1 Tax=Kordia sp. TaxID=1965332 RepID=UPI003D273CE4
MKKQKLGLNKLSLTKSRIAELNSLNTKGGVESTNPQCIFTGIIDGCDVTANNCPGTGGGGSGFNCGTQNPTCNTQAILSCLFAC